MYEMLEGKKPFHGRNQNDVMKKIVDDPVIYPDSFSIETKVFIEGLLCKDVPKRLGSNHDAEEIKQHSYFKDVDWKVIVSNIRTAPMLPPMEDVKEIKKDKEENHIKDSIYKPKVSYADSYQDFTYARPTLVEQCVIPNELSNRPTLEHVDENPENQEMSEVLKKANRETESFMEFETKLKTNA